MIRRPPRSPPFPSPPLSRSQHEGIGLEGGELAAELRADRAGGARHEDPPASELAPEVVHVEPHRRPRSEEHTSELQSRLHLVCRLLLEKKKKNTNALNAPRT